MVAEMVATDSGELVRTEVDVRVDPLTGHTSRIVPNRSLMPTNDFDLAEFAREPGAVSVLSGTDRAAHAEVAADSPSGGADR